MGKAAVPHDSDRGAVDFTDRAAAIGLRLDFNRVAEAIVDAVVEVTDFTVATITVREGERCRRVATAGLADGRIGMTTPYERWTALLNEEWRRGELSYLIPPEAPAQWADVPDIAPSDDPDAWTSDHGLVLTLHDHIGEIVGFVAVDEPRSGKLPDAATVDRLESFAREAQAAFVNARLYAVAQRQTTTMRQLFDVAKAMAATTDLDEVVPRIIEAMADRFDAFEFGVGRVVGPEIEVRRMRRGAEGVEVDRVALEGPLAGLRAEIEQRGFLVINDIADRPQLQEWLNPRTRALLAGAVDDGEDRMVTLSVSSERPGAFDADDVDFLRGLLDITTVAMRNADLYERARFAAERDALTGLRNRRMFWTTVEAMVAAADHASPMCLAVVDIDDFKRLNDAYGHDIGDRALCHVAKRLESGVRETDAVFRIGGEEFVVAMPDTRHEEAVDALERIRASVKRTRMADLPPVTISAGVAVTASSSATTAEALFAIADAALYKAKRAGKNRVLVADG